MTRGVEILAPVGGPESLTAAVRCGANAVYLGMKSLNARRGAVGFDGDELARACEYCRERGVAVYLTLNTLVFDSELPELESAIECACAAGVDAIIVQDLAAAALVRERAPSIELHASTQMSVHSARGARMLAKLGFSRVVLARELSKPELLEIHSQAPEIELECFVHGALCVCVSGQCYMSSMIGGRSGNRGMCAQPCRLPFASKKREHALSLKDLSLVASAGEMAELGICALKIEGRMKRPEYVAAAVTACREALEGGEPDYDSLRAVFSRSGFTRAYYDGAIGPDMYGVRGKEDVVSAAPALSGLAGLYRGERRSIPVDFRLDIHPDSQAVLRASDGDGNSAEAVGPVPEAAVTAPTDADRAGAALAKTGGTYFTVGNIEYDIDGGLMLPVSALNAMRREALERLADLRQGPHPHEFRRGALPEFSPHRPERRELRARLARAGQLTPELANRVDRLIMPVRELAKLTLEQLALCEGRLLAELPAVAFGGEADGPLSEAKRLGITEAVVGGLGGILAALDNDIIPHGDYSLNIANSISLAEYARMGLRDVTVSFELELTKVRALGGELPRGMIAYGYLPLMTLRSCPIGDCASCNGGGELTDRLGNKFFVDCDRKVSRLYNCVPLYLADRLDELGAVDFLTLYFTREGPDECARIAAQYREGGGFDGKKTRGLYYRKVL